jgi:WD40 repeat protein
LACGTGTSIIQIFKLNQPNTQPEVYEAHKGAVLDLDFISGKDILISVGSDKSIMLWNILTGEKRTIVTHATRIRTICISKDVITFSEVLTTVNSYAGYFKRRG